MSQKIQPLGQHLIAEFAVKLTHAQLEDLNFIREACLHALTTAGLNIAQNSQGQAQTLFHKFHPQGLTGLIVLEESHMHLSIWTEEKYMAIDLFTCGNDHAAVEAMNSLAATFKAERVLHQILSRGKPL